MKVYTVSCAGRKDEEGRKGTQVGPVLPERAPSEGPRSTAARIPTWVPFQEEESKRAWNDH